MIGIDFIDNKYKFSVYSVLDEQEIDKHLTTISEKD